jgi:hypothetical protein
MQIGISQNSGRIYRRSGKLNGNQVKTVFGNWGVIGQPATAGSRGAWVFDTNGYIGDVSPLVGAEVQGKYELNGVERDTTFFWVIDCPVGRPSTGGFDTDNNSNRQAFEPVGGYFNESSSNPAISTRQETWPTTWPDKDASWDGFWNGLFGKIPNADMETYFVMDDNNDNEYNLPAENDYLISFNPDPSNTARQGLGLEVKVRGLQWQQILAQDNIFWVYEIENQGQTTYSRTVFGMLVGTLVGGTNDDNSHGEYDDDWSFFNVNEDLTWTGDYPNDNSRNPFWEGAVGLVGYAFLESPGNPFDGIDNDNDAIDAQMIPEGPLFVEADFQEITFTNNPIQYNETNKIILIDPDTFERIVLTFPTNTDTFIVDTLGYNLTLISGITSLVEGNVISQAGIENVNENAYDGKDNDLDGIVDENYFLHYRQRRVTPGNDVLFDILNPVRHVDYVSGLGLSDGMIDERRDDGLDNDDDWSRNPKTGEYLYDDDGNLLDDYGEDGLPNTNDPGEYDGFPSPGEPNFDQTDKDESDQIGLSSFEYFVPSISIAMADDNDMWRRMRPGFFDVPETYQDGKPTQGEDGDFVYSSGYFPLTAGQTERMSLALIYGWDIDDMVKKLEVVRNIYNSDYRFPIAPDKPTLTAVPGDNKVTLFWDRAAESSFDPVLREFDFEGYKIYKSTDPNFNDVRVVTNSSGNVVSYKELASFDLIDNIFGWYYPPYDIYQILQGWSYNLGDETGLQHSYIDYDVENGRTYYYAVVSFDKGLDTSGVIPSECTKAITQTTTGDFILDINTAKVTPGKPVAGYQSPLDTSDVIHVTGDGFGTISYRILDPTALTGHEYDVYFWDSSNDGIDNNNNWDVMTDDLGADGIAGTKDEGEDDGKPTRGEPNLDEKDNNELEAITTSYAVKDNFEYKEEFVPDDTNFVSLSKQNLVESSIIVQDGIGNIIADSLYEVNIQEGEIRSTKSGVFNSIIPSITYQYHPIYFSEYIQGNPIIESKINDTDIFDGITLDFKNTWKLTQADTGTSSQWNTAGINYRSDIGFEDLILPDGTRKPISIPANYELRISNTVIDTTSALLEQYGIPPEPRKFEIFNTTGGYNIEYLHGDTDNDSLPSSLERMIFFERDAKGDFNIYTWQFQLVLNDTNPPYQFQGGEILELISTFPFNKFDLFRFQTEVPSVDEIEAKDDLDAISVYPNPYIVSHAFESALPPNVTSGRGERRVYFTNIPANAKIFIFTARGDHVITLKNDNNIFDGTVIWNLKTKENLDIAYGVYFYVVDSSVGKKRGKLAIIK